MAAASASQVKLLGAWATPFANRVQIALNMKSVNYEFSEQNIVTKSQFLLKSNPVHKKIPVLFHNYKPICESLVILNYIDEVWTDGPPILLNNPMDHALARFWAAYIDDKWHPLLRDAQGEAKAEMAKQVTDGLVLLEEAFEECDKGKSYFGGENIGYLDIALGCFMVCNKVREEVVGIKMLDEAQTPKLIEWSERFRMNDAVRDVVQEYEKLLEIVKMFQAKAKASAHCVSVPDHLKRFNMNHDVPFQMKIC